MKIKNNAGGFVLSNRLRRYEVTFGVAYRPRNPDQLTRGARMRSGPATVHGFSAGTIDRIDITTATGRRCSVKVANFVTAYAVPCVQANPNAKRSGAVEKLTTSTPAVGDAILDRLDRIETMLARVLGELGVEHGPATAASACVNGVAS